MTAPRPSLPGDRIHDVRQPAITVVVMIALITFALKYINSGMDEVFNPRLREL